MNKTLWGTNTNANQSHIRNNLLPLWKLINEQERDTTCYNDVLIEKNEGQSFMTVFISNLLQRVRIVRELEGGNAMEGSWMWSSGLSIQLHSWLKCTTVKGHQAQAAKGTAHSRMEDTDTSFKSPLPVASRRTYFIPRALNVITQCRVLHQGSSLETRCPVFSLGLQTRPV